MFRPGAPASRTALERSFVHCFSEKRCSRLEEVNNYSCWLTRSNYDGPGFAHDLVRDEGLGRRPLDAPTCLLTWLAPWLASAFETSCFVTMVNSD